MVSGVREGDSSRKIPGIMKYRLTFPVNMYLEEFA
nr:MAG TPA: hypothetical protein [Caudoviricetes sp.]